MTPRRSIISVSFAIALTTLIVSVLLPNISWSQVERRTVQRQQRESDKRSNPRGSSFEEEQRITKMKCRLDTRETPECGNGVTDRLTHPFNMEEFMKAERERIKRLQIALNARVQAELDVDGVPGQKTEQAVKRFQAQAGLPIDGSAFPGSETELLLLRNGKDMGPLRRRMDNKPSRYKRERATSPAVTSPEVTTGSEPKRSRTAGD